MGRLEVLCVAMQQKDFSLVEKNNIRCDAIIANQTNGTSFEKKDYPWGTVKLVSAETRGVGKNRNNAFLHASGDILLLSDDDMHYTDTYVEDVLREFDNHPEAEVIIFNIGSTSNERKQFQNKKFHRLGKLSRMPYGGPRIAIRKSSWERTNVWFTTLFGGGAKYTNGEDSIFLNDLKKSRMAIYASDVSIGYVDMTESSWYSGTDEEFFFNKGAYYCAIDKPLKIFWIFYISFRVKSKISLSKRIAAGKAGVKAFRLGKAFNDCISRS